MPRRDDIHTILVIGSGPIVIGQACEFDYSGTQACKALREEGYRVVLVNSNPATIMTDPETADRTYIEPMTVESVEKIIEIERPDVILLPTLGGQTALNLPSSWPRRASSTRYGVELIGAQLEAINKAEDRDLFREAMERIGLAMPRSPATPTRSKRRADRRDHRDSRRSSARASPWAAPAAASPTATRTSTSLVEWALRQSPRHECLIEQSVLGWKEYELEVMRDGPTTSSSSARSRTSTRWGSTPVTRSPWRRPRRSPTANTRRCATPRWPSSARSASTPAGRTSSSASIPTTAASWSSR